MHRVHLTSSAGCTSYAAGSRATCSRRNSVVLYVSVLARTVAVLGANWVAVSSGGRPPAKRFEVGGEDCGVVGAIACHRLPSLILQDGCVNFGAPNYVGGLALCVVVNARQAQGGQLVAHFAFALDEPTSAAKTHERAYGRGQGNRCSPGGNPTSQPMRALWCLIVLGCP
jgi:hypothetical protein